MRAPGGGSGGPGQRAFFVGYVPTACGGPAAHQGVGLHLQERCFRLAKEKPQVRGLVLRPGLLDAGQRGDLPAGKRGDTQAAGGKTSTSLSFPPSRSTAASRRRPVTRSLPSWATCPGWSCLPDSPRPAGTCGGTRWKARSRTSGQSVQRWPGRKGVSKNSLCKCPQRLIQNQDQTCL